MFPRLAWLTILLFTTIGSVNASAATGDPAAAASPSLPRRERNLDFLDATTLAYYLGLDPATGERLPEPPAPSSFTHNVAVMFYAQWDRNSHSLAPYWDHMGRVLKAGTKKSNLIMGLFDCELDQTHLTLCHAAGVAEYPTLMFISPSRTFPHKPHVQKSKRTLPHTTQYPGNWQYDKAILDWLRTMQTMTSWKNFWAKATYPKGWWQAASYNPSTANMLPVGIPGTTASSSNVQVQQQATALKELQAEKQQYEDLVIRSSLLLDATLFPIANPKDPTSTDVFAHLSSGGWEATDNANKVLAACAMEIALDYCVRVQTHKTDELIKLKTAVKAEQTMAELEAELKDMISAAEPYCVLVESCIVEGFTQEECKPATCPFQEEVACRYLSSCFDNSIQQDYSKALGLGLTEESPKKRGWF